MTDHCDINYRNSQGREEIMNEIVSWLYDNARGTQWLENGPPWAHVAGSRGVRVVQITPLNPLWNLLDHESRNRTPTRNYLMWTGHIWDDSVIEITHFGPLGVGQDPDRKKDLDEFDNYFLQRMRERFPSRQELDNMNSKQREKTEEEMETYIEREFLKIFQQLETTIEEVQKALKDVIELIFGVLEEGAILTAKLTKGLAPTAAKLILREIAKEVVKQVAKEIAKITAKQTGKSAAKKIPFLGAIVGVGFGAVRLFQGDPVRAGMEVASGAAACVPGAGTATSYAIDAVIAGTDVAEAIAEMNSRQTRFENLRDQLDELFDDKLKLEKAHEVIRDTKRCSALKMMLKT